MPPLAQTPIESENTHDRSIFVPFPREDVEQSIPEQFQQQVARYGDRLAIRFQKQAITYRDLNRWANRIAQALLGQRGVGPEPVALLFETGPSMIAAMLAVLKAGKFYVPLDIALPTSRLELILTDSQAQLILSDRHHLQASGLKPATLSQGVLNLDTLDPEIPDQNPEIQCHPDNLAYILYTSGSTGSPKGVMQNHRYVLNLCRNYTNSGAISCEDRFSLLYSAAFGGAVRDIYCALLNGASLFPLDVKQWGLHQLGRWLQDHQITVMFAVATLFRHFVTTLNRQQQFPKLRLIQIGSETVYRQDAESFQRHFGEHCTLMVNLGGTEISPVRQFPVTKHTVLTGNTVPAGYEVEGTEVLLWDQSGEEVPAGEVGEIVVRSQQVALGYWQQPTLTAQVFVEQGDRRYFKTGDLGRFLPDGCLLHLGRQDFQVKIRGYRVEISEVEATLLSLEAVHEAVVVAQADPGGGVGDQQLVAYLTPVNSQTLPTTNELTSALAAQLPSYMIPTCFVWLEALPLTATGKVDRRTLPPPASTWPDSTLEGVAPRTATEATLVNIWSAVLNGQPLGIENNFFELGGHSLSASQMLARVAETFSVNLTLQLVFEAPTIAQFAVHLEAAQQNSPQPPISIPPVNRTTRVPLALTQNRLWFLDQMAENKTAYTLFRAYRLSGTLNIAALEQTLQALVDRHEILRTRFQVVDGAPLQVIAPSLAIKLKRINLQGVAESERALKVEAAIAEAQTHVFDLSRGPLFQVTLIQDDRDSYYLAIAMHHIISDDWSMQVFLKEVSILYTTFCEHRDSPLAPLPIQYADYAHWQHRLLERSTRHPQLKYWTQQLAGAPPILEVPTDFPRVVNPSFQGAVVRICIHSQLSLALKRRSQSLGTTLFITLLTAFSVLLARHSNQDDIMVGTAIANRHPIETEQLLGFFVSTLALRIRLAGNPKFTDLLAKVHQTALDAYAHPDVPFDGLVEALQVERYPSIHPLFQAFFILQNVPQEALSLPGLSTELLTLERPTAGATFDLTLSLQETQTGLQGWFEYNAKLFRRETLQGMATQFETLLAAIVATPAQPVGYLPLLSQTEREQLLRGTQVYPSQSTAERCIHTWFADQVGLAPDAIALVFEQQQLTYQALNQRANQLAHCLQDLGIQPDTLVGICVERSLDMVVGILGILKAGGAYVPLDPTNPPDRLAYIVHDAHVKVLVTQSKLLNTVPDCEQVVCLDRDRARINQYSQDNPDSEVRSHHLAYVIYTSGSTGQPKGVRVTHQNVVRLFTETESWYHFSAADTWSLFHSYAFDFSVWELWGALLYGGRVVVIPHGISRDVEAFYQLLVTEQVTVLNQTPSAFYPLIQVDAARTAQAHDPETLALRLIIFGGEALDIPRLQPWFDRHGDQSPRLVNMYGITETTVHVTYRPLTQADIDTTESVIGQPIPDLQLYLLDQYQQPVPPGVRGEIYIGGSGVTPGYLHRPELTAERFIPNPFVEVSADQDPPLLYRTGDLARYLANGDLSYAGRIDNQIKLRGFRIELGEIEVALSQHPAIQASTVMVREDQPCNQQLVAYLIPDPERASPIVKQLQLQAQGRLTAQSLYELPNGMVISHLNRTETDFLYQEIYEAKCYLQHGITLNQGDCVFDVGANIGLFTLFAAQSAPQVKVYAFEPIPSVFEKLQLNTELYDLNAKLFSLGLAGSKGSATFTHYPHASVISGRFGDLAQEKTVVKSFLLKQQAIDGNRERFTQNALDDLLAERLQSQTITCQLTTLSHVICEHHIDQIDLLKIDVEKSEQDVLSGIQDQDWPKIKQLVVEVHNINNRLAAIQTLLRDHGYDVTVIQEPLLAATPLYSLYAKRPVPETEPVISASDAPSCLPMWSNLNPLQTDLRQHLKETLPEYMVPAAFVFLSTLPLTANGKLDRGALPAPDLTLRPQGSYAMPQTDLEKQIAEIWQTVLRLEQVDIHDNFFEIGGHSLLLLDINRQLQVQLNADLSIIEMFQYPTIQALSQRLSQAAAPAAAPAQERPKPQRHQRQAVLNRQKQVRQRHRSNSKKEADR